MCTEKCPAGYQYEVGSVEGGGSLEAGVNATLEECGERCLRNLECNSFEHRIRECELNTEPEPTAREFGNFVFCKNNGNKLKKVPLIRKQN